MTLITLVEDLPLKIFSMGILNRFKSIFQYISGYCAFTNVLSETATFQVEKEIFHKILLTKFISGSEKAIFLIFLDDALFKQILYTVSMNYANH